MPFTRFAGTSALAAAAAVAVVVAIVSPGDQSTEAVTLTGCLRTGGNAAVYILRGAAAPGDAAQPSGAAAAAAEDYLLVQVPSSIKLAEQVNRRVAITGVVSDAKGGPAPPAEANTAERALKRLTVQTAREIAPNCSGG